MAARAPFSSKPTQHVRYAASDDYGYGEALMEFQPGERIGGPLPKWHHKLIRRMSVAVAVMLGAWACFEHRPTLLQWAERISVAVSPAPERAAPRPDAADPFVAPQRPIAISEPAAGPDLQVALPMTKADLSPDAAEADDDVEAPPIERLPPPVADSSDPFQVRALAVGLHPGLSRVLLEKLSAIDYRNAGIAIKTALAETPDTEIFVWPRQRTPGLALFQVKFVPGATGDCRRYVVMITKEGWLTTASPMEKCGIREVRHVATAGARKKP